MKKYDLETRVQRLEDIEEIKNLFVFYAQGSDDQNDPDVMVPLFTEDGVFEIGSGYGTYVGHKDIREFLEGAPDIINWSLHYLISPHVVLSDDGNSADVFAYLWELATMRNKNGELEPILIGGTYRNDAVKLETGEWKFKHVRLDMEIMSPFYEGWVKKPFHDFGVPDIET